MVDSEEIFRKLNEGILSERSRIFARNLQKNLPEINRCGGLLPVVEKFRGRHVIVIGAGPSLEKGLGLLSSLRSFDEIVFIASDMSLKPLVQWGIYPEYVITCETTPVDFFSGIDTEGMHLLSFSCSSHSNIRKWRGGKSFYNWMADGEVYDRLWKTAGEGLGFVATGGIVTTQAVSLLLGCGIASLLITGNDMGFFDRFYLSGTVSSERKFFISNRLETPVSVEMGRGRMARDYNVTRDGELFYTNNQFLGARLWLERLFKSSPYPVAESGAPGCSPGIIQKIELAEYLEIFKKMNNGGVWDDKSS